MTAEGTVIKIIDETHALVKTVRKSACAECHKQSDGACRVCDIFLKSDTIESSAINKIGAEEGDSVIVESSTSFVIIAAAVVFMLPLILAILSYCIFDFSLGMPDFAPIAALIGFAVGIIAAVIFGKCEKNKERIVISKIISKDK